MTTTLATIKTPAIIDVYQRAAARSSPPTAISAAPVIHQRSVTKARRYSREAVKGSRHRRATTSGCPKAMTRHLHANAANEATGIPANGPVLVVLRRTVQNVLAIEGSMSELVGR